jgi:hypothetical protein
MGSINFLRLLEAYLVLCFVLTVYRRYSYYHAIQQLVVAFPARWPRVLRLLLEHKGVLLTWRTLRPTLVALALLLANSLALNVIWRGATVTPAMLGQQWLGMVLAAGFAVPMLALDLTTLLAPRALDRAAVEKQLDEAEYWLGSWLSTAVRVFTLGRVDPQRTVREKVCRALEEAVLDLNRAMWWWALQIGLRLAVGLSLWGTWAWSAAMPAAPGS